MTGCWDNFRESSLEDKEQFPQDEESLGEQVIFINGIAYNSRGFRVCGAKNQRGGYCARFGQCPFHKQKEETTTNVPNNCSEYSGPFFTDKLFPLQSSSRKFKNAWKLDEHQRFLVALKKFGHGNWIQIADYVGTRSASQCQSHAQKYYLRKRKLSSKANLKRSTFDMIDEDSLVVSCTGEEGIPQSESSTEVPKESLPSRHRSRHKSSPGDSSGKEKIYNHLSNKCSELSLHNSQESCQVRIFRNGDFSHGVEMELPSNLTSFFMKAAQLLGMNVATKAYTRSGFEISSLHQICPGDILWISNGEEFIFPSPV